MDFSRQSIVPKGRNKYGQYISPGNVAINSTKYTYNGNVSTGGGSGSVDEPEVVEDTNFVIFLEKTFNTFNRQALTTSAQTDTFKVLGYRNSQLTPVYIGDCSIEVSGEQEPAADPAYNISGLTTGVTVQVTGNGTTACTINVTMTNEFAAAGGALMIPANVSSDFNVSGDSYITWLMDNEPNSAKFGGTPSLFSSILQYSFDVDADASAASAYALNLTNDSAGINCDSAGNVLSGATRPTCKAELWYGSEKLMTGVVFGMQTTAEAAASGVSINTATGVLTFGNNFNFIGSTMECIVSAQYSGITLYKVMTITKQYPGADGTGATTRWITLSRNEIKFNPNNNSLSPSTITAKIMKQVNDEQPVEDTSAILYWGWDTETPTTTGHTGTVINVVAGHSYLAVGLRNSSNVYYELETVPIMEDGRNGSQGASGQSAYILQLSNQFSFVNVTSGGTVVDGQESNLGATATLYYGSDPATGVVYSLEETLSGISINGSTGEITFATGWGSQFTGDTMQITVLAKIGNILRGEAKYNLQKNYPQATSPYVLDLTVENSSVNMTKARDEADTAIYTSSIERLSCKATLYYGESTATGVTYSLEGSYRGVSINASTGVFTFNSSGSQRFNFSGDNLDIVVKAAAGGVERGRKILTISKVYPGSDGSGAVSYWAVLNAQAIHVSSGGTATPSAITAEFYEEIDGVVGPTPSITGYYGFDTTEPTQEYEGSIVVTGHTGNTYITFVGKDMFDNVERFRYTIPILKDGDKGADATKYWLVLSATASHVNSGATSADPSVITAEAWQQTGGGAAVLATGCSITYGYDTTNPVTAYSSTGITVPVDKHYITIKLSKNGVQQDIQTVPILKDGADGQSIQGRTGAAIRGPYEWKETLERRFSSGEGPLEEDYLFKDVIFRMVNGNKVYYYCNSSYNQTATTTWNAVSSAWTQSSENYDFVAANLILANNAKIQFMTGNEIYVSDSGGTVCAGMRGASSGDTIVFWAGADEPSNGNFKVDYNGSVTATTGNIGGWQIGSNGLYHYYDVEGEPVEALISPSEISIGYYAGSEGYYFNANGNGITFNGGFPSRVDIAANGLQVILANGTSSIPITQWSGVSEDSIVTNLDIYGAAHAGGIINNYHVEGLRVRTDSVFYGNTFLLKTSSANTSQVTEFAAPIVNPFGFGGLKVAFVTAGNAYSSYFTRKVVSATTIPTGSVVVYDYWFFNGEINTNIPARYWNTNPTGWTDYFKYLVLGTSSMVNSNWKSLNDHGIPADWVGMWLACEYENPTSSSTFMATGIYGPGHTKKGDTIYITIL